MWLLTPGLQGLCSSPPSFSLSFVSLLLSPFLCSSCAHAHLKPFNYPPLLYYPTSRFKRPSGSLGHCPTGLVDAAKDTEVEEVKDCVRSPRLAMALVVE